MYEPDTIVAQASTYSRIRRRSDVEILLKLSFLCLDMKASRWLVLAFLSQRLGRLQRHSRQAGRQEGSVAEMENNGFADADIEIRWQWQREKERHIERRGRWR
jgi:hypothetical protein